MKKIVLLFALFFFVKDCLCQSNSLPKIVNDTLYTGGGYSIAVGQQIKLGTGTRDNGDFKYITALSLPTPNGRPSMKKASARRTGTVKKIKPKGDQQKGYVYYIVIGTGDIVNYECDVENAIAAGEITIPDQYKPKPNNASQPASVADELTKLKKLYDDSVITKEEYEAQKKKLLDGNQ